MNTLKYKVWFTNDNPTPYPQQGDRTCKGVGEQDGMENV